MCGVVAQDCDLSPPTAISKLKQFNCMYLSDETLKTMAIGLIYDLSVSMSWEVKDPTQELCCNLLWTPSLNHMSYN